MKTSKLVIGIIIISFSCVYFLLFISILISNNHLELKEIALKRIAYPFIGLAVGTYLISSSQTNKKENKSTYVQHQYTEEERKIYFRNADYKAKPITEYQMDERTKLITYYDRMPFSYQKKLSDYADTLYRRYENEEYLKK